MLKWGVLVVHWVLLHRLVRHHLELPALAAPDPHMSPTMTTTTDGVNGKIDALNKMNLLEPHFVYRLANRAYENTSKNSQPKRS
jgi:hypothetical protein